MHTPRELGAVLFDLDGTLLDSRRAIVDAVARGIEEVARDRGHPDLVANRRAIVDALGLPADEYFRRVLPPTLLQHAAEVKTAATGHEVDALAVNPEQLYASTLPALQKIRARGHSLGIVSNAQREYFRAALHYQKLEDCVDYSECYEELPPGADPPYKQRLVERALFALSAPGRVSTMVGDRAEDLAAGRACGCRTIGVLHGFGHREELAEADHLARDLAEVASIILGQPGPMTGSA
jgi:phosphoglycolate phosphatase-like HAD superfamily hydrolase